MELSSRPQFLQSRPQRYREGWSVSVATLVPSVLSVTCLLGETPGLGFSLGPLQQEPW